MRHLFLLRIQLLPKKKPVLRKTIIYVRFKKQIRKGPIEAHRPEIPTFLGRMWASAPTIALFMIVCETIIA